MHMSHKEWVCTARPEQLIAAQAKYRNSRIGRGYVLEPLWRQISFTLNTDGVRMSLMSVDEEAALGGYWRGGFGVVEAKFTWADLDDKEFLHKLVAYEPFIVASKIMSMLESLLESRLAMRKAMASVFGESSKAMALA